MSTSQTCWQCQTVLPILQPVAGDMAEEPELYFVPLAGSRRKVANFTYQPRYIRQPLKFKTPESCSRAVAAGLAASPLGLKAQLSLCE